MEINKVKKVSRIPQPAFRLRKKKDEKSTANPITTPFLSPADNNNNCQMKAILTTDGSIKIKILHPLPPPTSSLSPPPLIMRQDRSKKVFLSKDSNYSMTPPSSAAADVARSLKNTLKTINLNFFDDDNNFDENEKYSQYKMTPRETFMAHVCHVSKNI